MDPKKRATLEQTLKHPWVTYNYNYPPFNYSQKRPVLESFEQLSTIIVKRMEQFHFTPDDLREAFQPKQCFTKPNACRASYYLIAEMIKREQIALRKTVKNEEQPKKNADCFLMVVHENEANTCLRENFMSNRSSIQDHTSSITNESKHSSDYDAAHSFRKSCITTYYRSLTKYEINEDLPDKFTNNSQPNPKESPATELTQKQSKYHSGNSKLKSDLKAFSAWFLNISITTSKSFNELLRQFHYLIGPENLIIYKVEHHLVVDCEIDINHISRSNQQKDKKESVEN